VFREKSGYEGADIADTGQPVERLTFDPQDGLTSTHGNHRFCTVEPDGQLTVLPINSKANV